MSVIMGADMDKLVFFIGALSLVQMIFLPGFLLVRTLKLQLPWLTTLILSFALSWVLNYILVMMLVTFHIYVPVIMWIILLLELIGLIALCWRQGRLSIKQVVSDSRYQIMQQPLKEGQYARWYRLVWYAAVLVTVGYVLWFLLNIGSVFTQWDPVVSWNMWALDFFHNHLPRYTFHYPQLIPANWSISYMLLKPIMGSAALQFFPKAAMPLFVVVLLLAYWDLALWSKRYRYVAAVAVGGLCFLSVLGHFIGAGWVDGPVAVMSFLAVYVLLVMRDSDGRFRVKLYWLAAVILAGAAVTKQAGIYTVIWFPALAYLIVWRYQSNGRAMAIVKSFLPWLAVIIIALPWYIYVQYLIVHGLAQSEIAFVTHGVYEHIPWIVWRIGAAFLAGWFFWVSVILGFWSTELAKDRAIFWFGLIYVLIWLGWFCYDTRNAALALPFISLAGAQGLSRISSKLSLNFDFMSNMQRQLKVSFTRWLMVAAIVIFVLSWLPVFHGVTLLKDQIKQQQVLDHPTLDKLLYGYDRAVGFRGKILTNWDYLRHLPGLGQYYLAYQPPGHQTDDPREAGFMINPKNLPIVLRQKPAQYILAAYYGGLITPQFANYLRKCHAVGKLKLLIHLPDFNLMQIMPGSWPAFGS